MSKKEDIEFVEGSGNAFRDLGLPNPEVNHAKAKLAARIVGILDDSGLSVRAAEEKTGFAYANFSRVRNADLGGFSLEKMIKILMALDDETEVYIDIRPRTTSAFEGARPTL